MSCQENGTFCVPCKSCKNPIPYIECEPDAIVGGNLKFEIGSIPCPYWCLATHRYSLSLRPCASSQNLQRFNSKTAVKFTGKLK